MHFTSTDERWMKNWFSAGKCNSFSKTFGLYGKNVAFWWKTSSNLSELHLTVRKIIFKKNNFSEELSFSYFFGTERENFSEPCLFTVDKTEFSHSGSHFWDVFPTISKFLIIFVISVRTFQYLAQNFWRCRQKYILPVRTNIWWRIGFRLQSVTVFHKSLDFTQKIVRLLVKKFSKFAELPLTCPEDQFEEKQLLEGTMFFFISFWNLEWKIFWPGTTLFVHCWQECVF